MPQYQTILAIDQGTTSTRSVIYDKQLNVISTYQLEQNQYFPHPGWVEQDPTEIFKNTQKCMNGLQVSGGDNLDIVAVGITNQRETTVVWDRRTGQPLYRAIGKTLIMNKNHLFQQWFIIINNIIIIILIIIEFIL
eukprot:gb/GECH01009640.1/.p1 GENE.gb/GECH01009640.1/~~gb/GECH01009640.1/.p1  ORF type:complete len:136 (+),score=19.80 gb/GECH01009640.1/:1-408(+)